MIWVGDAWWPYVRGVVGDTGFMSNFPSLNNSASFVTQDASGRYYIAGTFTNFAGGAYLGRTSSAGVPDTAWASNVASGPNSNVNSVSFQSDGKIIAVGNFTTWGGVTVNGIVRLNTDGSRDTTFTSNVGAAGGSGNLYWCAVQSDNKIIVTGYFTTWNGTASMNRIVRLNSDGTRDTTFSTNVGSASNSDITRAWVAPNGQIYLGGYWSTWNGTSLSGYFLRLNSDGTRDTTFSTNLGSGFNSIINALVFQASGKIVVGGSFTTVSGNSMRCIARLNSTGSFDNTFGLGGATNGFNSSVTTVISQPDGKLLVGGSFGLYNSVTLTLPYITRLSVDGVIDNASLAPLGSGPNATVSWLHQPAAGGRIVVVGNFATWNGAAQPYVGAFNF
jgi:uncharacterized delta-60 repeat protein